MVRLWRKPTPSKSPRGGDLLPTPSKSPRGETSYFQPPPLGRDGEGFLIHTTCHAEAGGDRREHGDDGLHDKLPSFNFVFHGIIRLIWLILWSRLSAGRYSSTADRESQILQNLIQN